MESSIGSEDDYIAADLEFHLTIAEATGNRVAALLMHALRDQLHRALGTVYQIPHSAELSLDQHREIVDAISARRPEEARAAMQAHIGRVEREIDTLAARNL
jgi:GntR family transcriptional repressor for pyruvate dehydrogenase complex